MDCNPSYSGRSLIFSLYEKEWGDIIIKHLLILAIILLVYNSWQRERVQLISIQDIDGIVNYTF